MAAELERMLKPHTHCHEYILANEKVLVCERASDFFAHALDLWVVAPQKHSDISFSCTGRHARNARAECLDMMAVTIFNRKNN